jgi:hypothetical protein
MTTASDFLRFHKLPTDGSALKYLKEQAQPAARRSPYANRMTAAAHAELATYRDAAALQLTLGLGVLDDETKHYGTHCFQYGDTQDSFRMRLYREVMAAPIYVWRDIWGAITGAKLPEGVKADHAHMPHNSMLWLLVKHQYNIAGSSLAPKCGLQGMLVQHLDHGEGCTELMLRCLAVDMSTFKPMVLDLAMGSARLDHQAGTLLHDVVAALSFLASPYIPKEELRPTLLDKHRARRALRKGEHHEPNSVSLVRLPSNKGSGLTGTGESRYNVQWLVRGHHRMQPYGKGNLKRRLQWIPPHVKGPNGAPMKGTVYELEP